VSCPQLQEAVRVVGEGFIARIFAAQVGDVKNAGTPN
jgi:hypothetical protein